MLATRIQPSIALKFQLTLEDYTAARYLHQRSRRRLHRSINLVWAALTLLLLGANFTTAATEWLGGATLASIFSLWLSYRFYRSTVRSLPERCCGEFSQQKMLRAERQITIFPTYLRIVSKHGGVDFNFADFSGYKCDGDILLVYHSPMFYEIIPRRHFPTIEDFDTFISYLDR
jgi:hypothetical protein